MSATSVVIACKYANAASNNAKQGPFCDSAADGAGTRPVKGDRQQIDFGLIT